MRTWAILAAAAGIAAIGDRGQAQISGDPVAGRAFALETCAVCHLVAENQRAPKRFANAPAFRAIANAKGTTEMSLHAFLSTPHPSMPELILTHDEQSDVIAYILSLRR